MEKRFIGNIVVEKKSKPIVEVKEAITLIFQKGEVDEILTAKMRKFAFSQ